MLAVAATAEGLAQDLAESLLAVADYQAFVQMMRRRTMEGRVLEDEPESDGGEPEPLPEHRPTGGYAA
eukprot:symbB.v1.2.000644.t1/scaffold7.1/size571927/12